MYFYYILVFLNIAIYLTGKKRYDYNLLYFLSTLVYTLPAFTGRTWITQIELYSSTIHSDTYRFVNILLVLIFLSSFKKNQEIEYKEYDLKKTLKVITFLTIILFSSSLILNLQAYKGITDKTDLSSGSRIVSMVTMLTYWSATIGGCIAVEMKKKKFIFINSIPLLFSLALGARSKIVIAFLSYFIVALKNDRVKINLKQLKYFISLVIFYITTTLIRYSYKHILKHEWSNFFDKMTDLTFYQKFLLKIPSESLAVFSNLNIAFESDLRQDAVLFIKRILNWIPLVELDVIRFTEVINKEFYHDKNWWGMASNIYAEFYVHFGNLGLLLIVGLYFWVISKGNKLLLRGGKYSYFFIPYITYIVFYAIRLDVSLVLGSLKPLLYIVIIEGGVMALYNGIILISKKENLSESNIGHTS